MEKFKKILSASPFFLIFFAVLGWLIYSSYYNPKMEEKNDFYSRLCFRSWDSQKQSLNEWSEASRQCRIQKWKDDGLYDDYVNWMLTK